MQPRSGLRSALMVIGSTPTRLMYADYLEWRGVSVREVTSAVAALDHLSAFTPDAAVVEDRLVDASGLDLVRMVRRQRGSSAVVPIVLLSSDVFGIDLHRATTCGCDALLTLPCLPEALFLSLVELVAERTASPRAMPSDSWLFVKGNASLMIVRTGESAMTVYGPGRKRRTFTFARQRDLVRFQVRYEHHLLKAGYLLEPFRSDRRVLTDRRESRRDPDRRGR